jgi:general nucleoside transport system permease protein
MISPESILGLVKAVGISSVPLILAALGGLISERAGVLNIALEGCIAAGAFATAVLTAAGAPPPVAILGATATGLVLGGLLAGVHLGVGSNLFIAGLGVNLLVPSLAGLISQAIYGHKGNIRIPPASPEWAAWAMIPLALSVSLMLRRSAFGRRIRAMGDNPEFIAERGLSPTGIRSAALLLSSVSAALAGAFLAYRIEAFVPGMSSGRGWMALVLIWLGFRKPMGIVGMTYLFSLIEIISGRTQGWSSLPASLSLALPYLIALVALALSSIVEKRHSEGLKK